MTPLGEILAVPERGLVYGNRGCLHDRDGQIRRSHSGKLWIACRLEFKGRRRPLLRPGRYTELFFLDDATALAAGHRPCAECRREDYNRFVAAWPGGLPDGPRAPAFNERLHAERLRDGVQRHHEAELDALPDGAFVLRDGVPWLVLGDALRCWTPGGYTDAVSRPSAQRATVVTPPSLVAVLVSGWRPTAVPLVHPSAG